MNRTDLVELISSKGDLSRNKSNEILHDIENAIIDAVASGESLVLVDFISIRPATRVARTGRNPKTGVAIEIPATNTAVMRLGKRFKEVLNPNHKSKSRAKNKAKAKK